MLETFLILLSGGVMLSVSVTDSKVVALRWLRLSGILALSFAGVGAYGFYSAGEVQPYLSATAKGILGLGVVCILMQLGLSQVARRGGQRWFAAMSVVCMISVGVMLIHRDRSGAFVFELLSCVGVAAMCGLVLMDMLIGHAYLTASQMTMAPFLRLNLALAIALSFRAICAIVIAHIANAGHPVDRLWGIFGLYVGTRWLIGLLVPAVFVYMAHDCIKRRATQSATGILYVAGVLIFIGEIIALQLQRDTGLPF